MCSPSFAIERRNKLWWKRLSSPSAVFNQVFVLMQYYGNLRRDPDDDGYSFWLKKLNAFNGDYQTAEMVKAFITSPKYRERFGSRFGPP